MCSSDLKELEALAEEHGNQYLHDRLKEVDPESAEAIHPNNRKRVIRALEFYQESGREISDKIIQKSKRMAMEMMKNAVEEKAYENQEAYQRTQMQKDMILERLREQGCRITRQRQLILDIILEEECSCCKEIYYKVQEKDRNIGPATIYRMVNMLEKIGAISRKNMYRISSCAACCQENGCTVRLSDATVCKLPSEVWKQVVREGLKNMGYIGDQDIESIEMTMSKCGA